MKESVMDGTFFIFLFSGTKVRKITFFGNDFLSFFFCKKESLKEFSGNIKKRKSFPFVRISGICLSKIKHLILFVLIADWMNPEKLLKR